jgi:hypothetical protein
MTRRQAEEKGYQFTGSYNWNSETQKTEAARIRQEFGCRACVVFIPSSPLSRGSKSGGYSVYADRTYFAKRRLAEVQKRQTTIPAQRQRLQDEFEQNVAKLEAEQERLAQEAEALIEELGL